MLRTAAVSHHTVRTAVRQARLRLAVELAEDRREFLEELHRGSTALILAGPEGLPELELREVLERARNAQPAIPVILVGKNAPESEALRRVGEGVTEYVREGQTGNLPSVLARTLKVREASAAQALAQSELNHAAGMLRENQKLITIGRLTASIAHEINNPLESVTNLLYLLGTEKRLSAAARGYLALAQRELERAGQICRQTLNFSRETAGPTPTRIDRLMEEVLALYGRRIAEKSLRVERRYDSPGEVTVFPGEMRQVLSNLVTNAIEASMPQGRLVVRIRRSRRWRDGETQGVRVAVGDNGSGIARAVQRRLGEAFFTTKGQGGTGLGLWVTRAIIERYGGEMQLRSSVGEERHGTVFSIFLPANQGPRRMERPRSDGGGGEAEPASAKVVPLESAAAPRNRVSELPARRRANGC
jgi:signal transduction histidine kinase